MTGGGKEILVPPLTLSVVCSYAHCTLLVQHTTYNSLKSKKKNHNYNINIKGFQDKVSRYKTLKKTV